ncbi:MAG: hypothetical protein CVV47_15610 [Spirochaetae bacterium HGW-Spirochaetae-3]|nr:MAG: hypothetical protein CVV47_15610 [Spirochaetae bacterium HGW-Spirochaetae-3]
MKRIEIIANRSVEEDLMEAFAKAGVARGYTKFPVVHGAGRSGPKVGDAIWPEENFALVVYCEADEAALIEEAVRSVKEKFPNEGVKVFSLG